MHERTPVSTKALPAYIHKYPFIRFLIPLITGIFFCDSFLYDSGCTDIVIYSLSAFTLLFFILHFVVGRHSFRWLFGASVYLFFFALGIGITVVRLSQVHCKWEKDKAFYEVQITDVPQEKSKSIACPVIVLSPINKKALLYFLKDSLSKELKCGDKLLLYATIISPVNRHNPETFDYASYLLRKGISGTGFVGSGNWQRIGGASSVSLRQKAAVYREKVIEHYRNLGFEGKELSVLSALTLGDKEELSQEVKDAYSTSGVSHLLALSGLHIGIICTLFAGLLFLTTRLRVLFIIVHLFVIALLWGYACFTGLSPSVIRSVTMFTLLILAKMGRTKGITLNTLAVAAFLMLLWNPFYLFDVSFQLSFVSVASILILQPFLYRQIKVENRVGKYVWGLLTVTMAAQIGTCPIVMYYFSGFPVYFLLTNLFAVPWVFVIMYATVLMLVLGFVPFIQVYVAGVIGWMIKAMNECMAYVSNLPYSSIGHIWIAPIDMVIFYSVIALLALYVVRKYRRAVIYAGAAILFLCLYHTNRLLSNETGASIIFYDNHACPAIHFVESPKISYLLSLGDKEETERMQNSYQRYWDSRQMDTPQLLTPNKDIGGVWKDDNMVYFRGKTVCILSDNRWRNKMVDRPLFIDYLYVCRGFKGRLATLAPLFETKKVILDSSLSAYRHAELKDECRLLGVDFISISEKGSLHIGL